ncbi:MAG: efflux RND transporter permease subunit [Fibrobacter sp.]|nr:efflux RND transporter permease subunit [Fibrobacter sp.]
MKILQINKIFNRLGKFQTAHRRGILIGIILFTLAAAAGILRFEFSFTNDGWFLEGDPAKVNAEKFREHFGNDASVVVLVTAREVGNVAESAPSVRDSAILEMRDTLSRYMLANIPLAKEIHSIENTAGTEALLHLSLERYTDPADDAAKIGRAVADMLKRPEFKSEKWDLNAGGEPYLEVAKNDSTMPQAARSVVIGVFIMIFCLAFFTRSKFGVLVPLMAIAFAMASVFGICGWLGVKPDFTLFTLPLVLGMALSVGYSIHYINSFKQAYQRLETCFGNRPKNRDEALVEAVTETGWPIFFTVVTTVASMLSFLVVEMPVMKIVGSICAAMVFAVYLYVIILVPILFSYDGKGKKAVAKLANDEGRIEKILVKIGGKALNMKLPIALASVAVAVASAIGCMGLKVNMEYVEMFGTKLPFVERLVELMDSELANVYSYNVMIDLGDDSDSASFKNPEKFAALDSAVTDLSNLPLTKFTEGKARVMVGGVTDDFSTAYIHVELKEWNSKQIDVDIDSAQALVRHYFPKADVGVEGYAVEQASMNNKLVKGEIKSVCVSFVMIVLLLIASFMSVKTGLIGMIPNVAPILVIGAVMGYCDFSMDMMTMMVIPMAIGIAVDDTIHFVNHSKLCFERCGNYRESVLATFRDVGKSMVSTTIILCMMFLAYMVSPVTIFFRVGLMASIGLVTALVADFTITPVLIVLTKPFGKGFKNQKSAGLLQPIILQNLCQELK